MRIGAAAAAGLMAAGGAFAQTYTVLYEFDAPAPYGSLPVGGVVSDGARLYGVTLFGGEENGGSIYAVNLDGTGFATVHSFGSGGGYGEYPNGGLAIAGGVLYGTTEEGGAEAGGSLYSVGADGAGYRVLHSFPANEWGGSVYPGPAAVAGDTIYGVVRYGGSADEGFLYSIKTDGTGYAVIHEFAGPPTDGEDPRGAILIENGTLYGAARWGGKYYTGAGAVFSLAPSGGAYRILHDFSMADGAEPLGALVSDGNRLYGIAAGSYPEGIASTVFAVGTDGSGFETLHTFDSCGIGSYSVTGLATDGGRLFGTVPSLMGISRAAARGPVELDPGAVFTLKTDGTGYTELYRFDGVIGGSGSFPTGTLLLHDGALYGVALGGGVREMGVIYSLTLPPPCPIDLTLNTTSFFTTDRIAVRAGIAAIPVPCAPFVRIVRPDGGAYYVVRGAGFTEAPTPFLGVPGVVTVPAPIYDYPVFDAQFRGIPAGTYYLEGGAVDTARTADLLDPAYVGSVGRVPLVVR